jgi:YbbR domain-containing protein
MSENRDSRQNNENSETKTELANRIAGQSQRVASTYQHIEDSVVRAVRWFSLFIDNTLFNGKYTKLVSLILAILLYTVVNYNSRASLYTNTLKTSREISGVPVTAKYNADTFELTGLPESADLTLTGDATSVTSAANSKGIVIADLEGLTEGTHEVKLETEGYGDSVGAKIDPSNVIITLKKKTTQAYDLSYDFINQDKMDSIYSVGTPSFEYTKVNVRASKDTLNSIAFVKALIDVSGQTADFTQDAKLIAYDVNGMPVKADIYPSTISVTVPVTSPNKSVAVSVEITGEVPDGQAIESIEMDQQSVTIYGPESVLGQIDKVVVTLNASTITKDSTIMRPITLPTGVNSSNINQITMTVTLGEGVSRRIEDIKINYRNNTNNYKASQPENKTTTSVTVFGTESNIENITADDVYVYVDMKDAKPGMQEFPLEVEQPAGGLVRYILDEATYQLNVLGETNDDGETGEGAGINNG